jgi:hypothetical protein
MIQAIRQMGYGLVLAVVLLLVLSLYFTYIIKLVIYVAT